ncbi:FGGY family carbohydrate kinase [Pseudozobellia thermophila]|uniref:ATP:glycerol 3-phosphotransferase n=1 Tax=Pseudozobellia thermophila TaxID=192903 RepID=A0A1M6CE79_9FLAO|nr:glycerol kinase GlpK [Pseudozobellia thermophila]SHI59286.1 glycerol kinase [Pseudozobellia thermophila]
MAKITSNSYILSIDQGTSGTKAILFHTSGRLVAKATEPLKSYYPKPGFVEQDPDEIYNSVIGAVKKCCDVFKGKNQGEMPNIVSCGISNQRETFVIWDKNGNPLRNAVVWQCKRSVAICEELDREGLEESINKKTGLTIDPYFSATKVIWLYRNEDRIKRAIDRGEAFFGTIDSWLLFKLTKGEKYLTDHTNASRTLLYNIFDLKWDAGLIGDFGVSGLRLPEVLPSASHYGESDFDGVFERAVPITGMIGDSHAAFFGEGCFETGMAKATLGTGSSILWNAEQVGAENKSGVLTTVAYSLDAKVNYAFEGVIVSCGSTLEWLRSQLGVFSSNEEIETMATSLTDNEGVYLVPAFSGMGAPYWEKGWKGSIHGLTFGTTKNHLVRAALESIAFQIKDVIQAIELETGHHLKELNVDGGITANRFLMQFMADLLQKPVINIGISDVSALGAAFVSGMGAGIWKKTDELPRFEEGTNLHYFPQENRSAHRAYAYWQFLLQSKNC